MTLVNEHSKIVYWHRELPPVDAELAGEHTLEATSCRVPDTIAHREELWNRCKDDLMVHTCARLTEEIARLGGRYADVSRNPSTRNTTQLPAKPGSVAVSPTCCTGDT